MTKKHESRASGQGDRRAYGNYESRISSRGQTVVPKEVREALGMVPGAELRWLLRGETVIVFAMPEDPIAAMKGALKDFPFTTADLLEERRKDRDREEAKVEETLNRWRGSS